ncbi:hypothetical protein SBV1_3470006 [Verrucomicrobia bacterium]|nr:hypothetical protein SBV1_3470006 [Verrucomicrobiota bacterium]
MTGTAGSVTLPNMSEPEIPFSLTRIAPANRRECKRELFINISIRSAARVVNEPLTNPGGRSYGHFSA